MKMLIIESNDLPAKFDDDLDFDLDNELRELTEHDLDTNTEDEMIEEEEQEDDKERTMYDKERTMCLDKINKQIDHINLLARIRNGFSNNVEEICGLMNEFCDEIYSDDSWLGLAELNKINVLLDEVLNYVWKTFYDKNREKHERINIYK